MATKAPVLAAIPKRPPPPAPKPIGITSIPPVAPASPSNSGAYLTAIFLLIVVITSSVMLGSLSKVDTNMIPNSDIRTKVNDAKQAAMGLAGIAILLFACNVINETTVSEATKSIVGIFMKLAMFVALILLGVLSFSLSGVSLDDVDGDNKTHLSNARNSSYIVSLITLVAMVYFLYKLYKDRGTIKAEAQSLYDSMKQKYQSFRAPSVAPSVAPTVAPTAATKFYYF